MTLCDLTLPSPEENLACDEALLDLVEAGQASEILRLWQPAQYFVVVGYGNKVEAEVNTSFCEQHTIPILRRCTGGGTVLQGPGALNYSLILLTNSSGPLHSISTANQFILKRHESALTPLVGARVEMRGCTDLAIGGIKFCGNAQRRKKRALLFHGSFLLHFDIRTIEKALPMPSKQPDYRLSRSHCDFLMNLKLSPESLKAALARTWQASGALDGIPLDGINRLAREKYSSETWNFKL